MPILSTEDRIGTVLGGRYRLVRVLGEGGMGAVFEGEHLLTGRRVAIKVMHPEAAQKQEHAARFLQEARNAAAIAHPHIVQVLDMGSDDAEALYLVLEYLDGEDLDALLTRQGKLPWRTAFDLLLPVIDGLAAAHAKGIIHRDLKPGNIFLARTDNQTVVPKLLDFGISKVAGLNASHTMTGAVLGTPYYMAPEQARGDRGLDLRIDVWSMGVVLYETMSGCVPFDGDNYNQIMMAIVSRPPVPLTDVAPLVPPEVAAIVHRALASDRAARFASMTELAAAMNAVIGAADGSDLAWRPGAQQSVALPTVDPTQVALVPRGSAPTRTTWERQRPVDAARTPGRGPIVVVGIVAVALVAGFAFALRRTGAPARPAPTAASTAATTAPAAMPPSAPVTPPIVPVVPIAAPSPPGVESATSPPGVEVTPPSVPAPAVPAPVVAAPEARAPETAPVEVPAPAAPEVARAGRSAREHGGSARVVGAPAVPPTRGADPARPTGPRRTGTMMNWGE